jgi:menaquinone-dependent protoporphyrinogen oxidase
MRVQGGVMVVRILVSAASRHGSTSEIAARIGAALGAARPDAEITISSPHDVADPDAFDAYVLGSAVYMGHWLDAARDFVGRVGDWRGRPVWLFSSGPIGTPPKPNEYPVDVGEAVAATRAREHRLFAGALVRERLSFGERAMTAAFRAEYGDFRDWTAIEAWARKIAGAVPEA